ncbi:hypothetical protein SRHO_G00133710 [Serrasalmus rhombeus]
MCYSDFTYFNYDMVLDGFVDSTQLHPHAGDSETSSKADSLFSTPLPRQHRWVSLPATSAIHHRAGGCREGRISHPSPLLSWLEEQRGLGPSPPRLFMKGPSLHYLRPVSPH